VRSRQRTLLPVQVEAVTFEDLRNAVDWDLDEEFRQLVAQLRNKSISLRKRSFIDESTFIKLLHLQGIVSDVFHMAA